jgi:hypothetical protein
MFCTYYSTINVFDPKDIYPYRFALQPYINFPEPVPVMELGKLLDKNTLWTIRTFEKEARAGFSSVNPINAAESQAILNLFWRYNHRMAPSPSAPQYNHSPLTQNVNFNDLVLNNVYNSTVNLKVDAANFGQTPRVSLEEALHCFMIYNLTRCSPSMKTIFGNYTQVLREVPVSTAGQQRSDLLLIYENPTTGELRWTPSLGQDRGYIKSGSRCPQGTWY